MRSINRQNSPINVSLILLRLRGDAWAETELSRYTFARYIHWSLLTRWPEAGVAPIFYAKLPKQDSLILFVTFKTPRSGFSSLRMLG